jgi:hypothetical protein
VVTAKTFLIQESVQGLKGAYYKIKKGVGITRLFIIISKKSLFIVREYTRNSGTRALLICFQ